MNITKFDEYKLLDMSDGEKVERYESEEDLLKAMEAQALNIKNLIIVLLGIIVLALLFILSFLIIKTTFVKPARIASYIE